MIREALPCCISFCSSYLEGWSKRNLSSKPALKSKQRSWHIAPWSICLPRKCEPYYHRKKEGERTRNCRSWISLALGSLEGHVYINRYINKYTHKHTRLCLYLWVCTETRISGSNSWQDFLLTVLLSVLTSFAISALPSVCSLTAPVSASVTNLSIGLHSCLWVLWPKTELWERPGRHCFPLITVSWEQDCDDSWLLGERLAQRETQEDLLSSR